MTFSEYLTYKAPRGFKDELIHGEIRLSPSAKAEHQEICKRLERLLDAVIPSTFIAQRDTTIYVAGAEGPRPDVFVMRKDRWNQARKSSLGYPEGVPELVIEVRSASNSDPDLEQKRSIYFSDARCLAFWVVSPETKSASVLTRSAPARLVLVHSLELPVEIGGSVSINDIFE
jgi:Uma2 family endonuclease